MPQQCPQCYKETTCYCTPDCGGVDYYDEYVSVCPAHGVLETKMEYGGSFSSSTDQGTTCPYCGKRYSEHEAPPLRVSKKPLGTVSREDLTAMVREHATVLPALHPMVVSMCAANVGQHSYADAAAKITAIRFEHKVSTPDDDDVYWASKNPFDDQWYLFASSVGGGMPRSPVSITPTRPSQFTEV